MCVYAHVCMYMCKYVHIFEFLDVLYICVDDVGYAFMCECDFIYICVFVCVLCV